MTGLRGRWTTLLLVGSALALAACSTPVKLDGEVPVESRTPTAADAAAAGGGAGAGAGAGAAAQSQVASVNLAPTQAPADSIERIVYFDFDSYVIKNEYRPIVETHAKRLTADRNLRIVVEGHTDERGGREYNLALGQRRAEAVVRSMTLLGANPAQLEAVSFGKERPAVAESNERAWALNRRAEIKDR